eukprot:3178903-Prymnesium_polylepis.2
MALNESGLQAYTTCDMNDLLAALTLERSELDAHLSARSSMKKAHILRFAKLIWCGPGSTNRLDNFWSKSFGTGTADTKPAETIKPVTTTSVANPLVTGCVGQWPGSCDNDVVRMQLHRACGDALGNVPAARWTLEATVDVASITSVQAHCVRHGGFVTSAQYFDARLFGISSAEA